MSAINTGSIAKLLWPGLNARWGNSYAEHSQEWKDLVDTFTSERHREEDQELTGFGLAPVKAQGTATVYDTMAQGYTSTYNHVAYSLGFVITREAFADNLYEKVGMQRTGGLAFSMRQTKENVVANLYNRAFNSSYTGGDGKELLATDHPSLAGTWQNELTTAADLSEASLEDLVILIGGATNSRGLKIAIKPKSLIIPYQLQFEAERILKSVGQSGTANNDINALRTTGAFPGGVKVNHFFTDSDAYFIRTDVEEGLKLFQRDNAEFKDEGDFDTDNRKYKAYERYSVGWSDPRALFGSPGS